MMRRLHENLSIYDIHEAIDAAIAAGCFSPDEIDEEKSYIIDKNGFSVGVVVKTGSKSLYDNTYKALYSFNTKKMLTDGHVVGVYSANNRDPFKDDYIIFEFARTNRDINGYRNIITKNGVILDEMADNITTLNNGMFIISDDNGSYVCDLTGKYFTEPFDTIDDLFNGKFLFLNPDDDDRDGTIVDLNFNIIVDHVYQVDEISSIWRDDHDYFSKNITEEYVLDVKRVDDNGLEVETLYDSNMNIIVDDVLEVNQETIDHSYKVIYVSAREGYTIIGRDSKSLFKTKDGNVKFVSSIEQDFAESGGYINLVESFDGKYNLVLADTLELFDDDWFDEIVYIENEVVGYKDLVALKRDGKCNIICACKDDLDNYLDYLIEEPVDNLYQFGDDDEMIIVKKDGKSYLFWTGKRLFEVKPNNVYDTNINVNAYNHIVYIQYDDEKMDILRTDSEETFCEKYLKGKKIDMILDLDSYYPLIQVNGKYTYVNLEMFRPAMYNNGTITWFDDAELAEYDEDNDEVTFNVVYKGEKRTFKQ